MRDVNNAALLAIQTIAKAAINAATDARSFENEFMVASVTDKAIPIGTNAVQ